MIKRAQGRPSRAEGAVGRAKIVEGIRAALRSIDAPQTSRKDLSRAIGVTPALITYYFPEPDMLVCDVCAPVIAEHRRAMADIVNRRDRPETKLNEIISTLYKLYRNDRNIYEWYKELEKKFPETHAETSTMSRILMTFLGGSHDGSQPFFLEVAVLHGAVRGMCEVAERIRRETEARPEMTISDPTPTWLRSISSLLVSQRSVGTASRGVASPG